MTWAMSSGAKASASAVSMRMPSFAPTATAARSCSTASAGPTVSTVTVPPVAEAVPIASSTAHSSCEDMVWPSPESSMPVPVSSRVTLPAMSGTRLMQTRMSMAIS